MELEEFISKTLINIVKGINLANKDTKMGFMIESNGRRENSNGNIHFDIAVTVTKKKNQKGKMGIGILSVGLSGAKEKDTSDQMVSRIKFDISSDSLVGLS